ncbi:MULTISPECIES: hypothetical protein [Nocardia]|uniref:Uncharacterized protein n=1 Tax=Nocardia arthritidis TaxID=228602 RepID=A0A6G9YB08_9NOCA|nr:MULTISPECIES: hypothetical protein [Nocardia]QIS10246.1 hypothetical protein F5544_11770 [Nocardia arthritidis]
MSSNYQPPAGWSPPGAQFRSKSTVGRTVFGTVFALVVTPIGIGLAANGAADTRQWIILGDATARWGSSFQIIGGALLLFLVAAFAAYSPAGTAIAGLVWGLVPGLAHVFFPEDTFTQIHDLPALSDSLRQALYSWVINGFPLLLGALLIATAVAATLRRRTD